MWCILFSIVLVSLQYDTVVGAFNENCNALNPQLSVDIDSLMGLWLGVEVIPHTRPEQSTRTTEQSTTTESTCPVIHLSDATNEMSTTETPYRPGDYGYNQRRGQGRGSQSSWPDQNKPDRSLKYLKLYWTEKGKGITYFLQYNNSVRGLWLSTANYKGDPYDYSYNQFTGTVQVIKAVGNHLVLYFCERLPDSKQFTIVLSRQKQQLNSQDIQSIHNLLHRRDLPVSRVQEVCNSVNALRTNLFAIAISLSIFFWKTLSL